nr:translocation/assembly module TamB domain-containing protein [uncultured Carboxylicivirga sp.]
MIKKSIKYLSFALTGLLVIILLLVLFTQTQWFDNIVRNETLKIVNKQLNAAVSIKKINSNYYNFIDIEGIELRTKEDSSLVSHIKSIQLQFNIWALLHKKIDIQSVHINELSGNLQQDKKGEWQIVKLFPTTQDTTKSPIPFAFIIQIDTIQINNCNLATDTPIEVIPDSIQDLNINASLRYKADSLTVNLQNLNFITQSPNLTVKQITGRYGQIGSAIRVDSLLIKTGKSLLNTNVDYNSINNSKGQFIANPINNDELSVFIPSIKIPTSPKININYLTQNDTTFLTINLGIKQEKIHLQAQIQDLEDYSQQKTSIIPFKASLQLSNIHPENWWLLSETNSTLNGNVTITGMNLFDYKSWNKIEGNLKGSTYLDHYFSTFLFKAQQKNANIHSSLVAQSYLGKIDGHIDLNNYTSNPNYSAQFRIDSLLLSKIITEDAGIINGEIELIGSGLNSDSLNIESEIKVFGGTVYNIPIDSADIKASVKNNLLSLKKGQLFAPGARLDANGQMQLQSKQLNAQIDFAMDTLLFLQQWQLPELSFHQTCGNITVNGSLDSLLTEGNVNIIDFSGYSVSFNNIQTAFDAQIKNNDIIANTSFQIQSLTSNGIFADTIYGEINYQPEILMADIYAQSDSINAKVKTKINLTDTLKVNLDDIRFNTPHVHYYLPDTISSITYYNNEITINNLNIKDELTPEFNIQANGNLGANNLENFDLSIDNFDLNSLSRLHLIEEYIDGLFSSRLSFNGNPQAPYFQSSFDIKNGEYGNIQAPDIEGAVSYNKDTLHANIYNSNHKNAFNLNYKTPLELKFDSSGLIFNLSDYFEAVFNLDSLNIATPTEKVAQLEVQGHVDAHITAKGNYSKPLFYGNFNLKDGAYNFPKYGIDFNNANISLVFDSNKVAIDTFIMKRDKGYLTLTGEAVFDTSLVSGTIHSSTLEADAKNFYVIKHRDYSALIDAKTFFNNTDEQSKFGGNIKVIRSEFYLPAFIDSDNSKKEQNVPLLVQATDQTDTTGHNQSHLLLKKKKEETSPFITNLQGRLKLEIPRNTWLRSEDMSLEIWGDLDIEKSNPYFELYGDVGINRGYYILYGKKLVINEGTLTFQGGQEIDPILDFKASYTYRGPDKQKRTLNLAVSDRLSEPSISFTLDDASISEGDAVSILIFGKTMDELSYSGQNGIAGSIGTDMLAKALTSQLSKTLGTRLNLDMIEVTATENWQSAAFVVGKYVTNDLFVIYQRGFGETDGDEITPEMIILEYELNKILFVRLQSGSSKESGFDVILKFESKND